MSCWDRVLELDSHRQPVAGSTKALCNAIRSGADLRVGTAFRFNEHIDTSSSDPQIIREQMDFRVTYLIEDRFAAGVETLRMPISLPDGFGERPSFSFFLYNQDGHQAVAKPFLDGGIGASMPPDPTMPKLHVLAGYDDETRAPSTNFIYDFEYYRFMVRDAWRQVLAHDANGQVTSGSVRELADLAEQGHEVKVALRGLCDDLAEAGSMAPAHEVFVHLGPCYYCTKDDRLMGGSNPVVRVPPSIPLSYASGAWDFGSLMPRTDGMVATWLCNPLAQRFERGEKRCAIRWFIDDDRA